MKSSLLSLFFSISMIVFFTACGSDSGSTVVVPSTPNEGSSSSFVGLTGEEFHSARVGDAGSDTDNSYYTFTTTEAGDHNISITALSGLADLNFNLFSDSGLTNVVATAADTSDSGEEKIVTLNKDTIYYLVITNNIGSAVTFDLLVNGPVSTLFESTVSAVIPNYNLPGSDVSDPLLSEINVANATTSIAKITVTINITHTWDADLDIFLISPSRTRVELSTFNGGSDDNYINTVFDDAATDSIVAGSAPFTGSFSPETPLSDVNDEDANGVWTLEIRDTAPPEDGGTLNSWSMTIN